MPDELDIVQRIGRQVREHDTRLDLHEERLRGLERINELDNDGDLRRRVEQVEKILSEHNALMRESVVMISRLNETLLDLRKQLEKFEDSESDTTSEVARIKVITNITAFLGGAIVLAGVGLITTYLFKVPT